MHGYYVVAGSVLLSTTLSAYPELQKFHSRKEAADWLISQIEDDIVSIH